MATARWLTSAPTGHSIAPYGRPQLAGQRLAATSAQTIGGWQYFSFKPATIGDKIGESTRQLGPGCHLLGVFVTVIELAMTPGQAVGTFRVEVVRSPAGEASAVIALDVEPLLAQREHLEQAVLASAVASRAILPQIERPVREIGQTLFSALLGSGDVAGRYRASAALAAERGQGLRVVLRADTPALAGLPWEAMYDGRRARTCAGEINWSGISQSPRRRHYSPWRHRCGSSASSLPRAAWPRWM